jgi:hypothetical protein
MCRSTLLLWGDIILRVFAGCAPAVAKLSPLSIDGSECAVGNRDAFAMKAFATQYLQSTPHQYDWEDKARRLTALTMVNYAMILSRSGQLGGLSRLPKLMG